MTAKNTVAPTPATGGMCLIRRAANIPSTDIGIYIKSILIGSGTIGRDGHLGAMTIRMITTVGTITASTLMKERYTDIRKRGDVGF